MSAMWAQVTRDRLPLVADFGMFRVLNEGVAADGDGGQFADHCFLLSVDYED